MEYISNENNGAGENTSEKQNEVVNKVTTLFEESKKLREPVAERMKKNEALYINQPPENVNTESDMKLALAHSAVETLMPILGDYFPTIHPHGKQSNDFLFQDYMSKRMTSLLEAADFRSKGLAQSKDSLIYRNGYMRLAPIFDYTKDAPKNVSDLDPEEQMEYKTLSGLDLDVIDPFAVFPDPYGTGLELYKNCRYFIIAEPKPKAWIAAEYNKDIEDIPDSSFNWEDYRSNSMEEYAMLKDLSTDGFSLLVKCYWTGDSREYPYGRLSVICEGTLLEDSKIEIPFTPYFRQSNYTQAGRFFGFGEPELMKASIFAINSSASHVIDNLSTFGKPKEIMTPEIQARMQQNPDEEDTIIADSADQYRLLTADPVPPSIFRYTDTILSLHDKSAGLSDVMEGNRPAGVTSARGIEALREASMIRVRFKIKYDITPMMRQMGRYLTYLIAKYDIEESEVRIENPNEGGERYLRLNPKAVYSRETKTLLKKDEIKSYKDRDTFSIEDTEMDITIEIGRGTEKGSVARELQAEERYEKGLIPIDWYINEMQISNKQELMKYHREKNEVLQIILALKRTADKMKESGIRNARDWSNSQELKTIRETVKQLQDMDLEMIAQTRF